jgi:hypothetical protein
MAQRAGRWKKRRSRRHEIWISVAGVLFFASLGVFEIVSAASNRANHIQTPAAEATNAGGAAAEPVNLNTR